MVVCDMKIALGGELECTNYCEMGTFHTVVAFGHEHFQTMNSP